MPKLIKNIETRLIDELENMIFTGGSELTLRALAERAGIAVGTIYNYFPDKDDLLKALFQREWSNLITEIVKELDSAEVSRNDQIRKIVGMIYELSEQVGRTLPQRKTLLGGCKEKGAFRLPSYPHRPEGWLWLREAFRPIWNRVFPDSNIDVDRLTIMVVSIVPRLIFLFPEQGEENMQFITQLIQRGTKEYGATDGR
ncbi:TetR/AcrR family transcriptional regulator [Sediminispirochaeta smaragdinae]|uniref:Transcriptional regulator, TetR family n=1 Tax=Sediminispirochaeta smaragdinae (strain DSM 11293 / JCM 15392 / SEBR 4228) TaxID=573413 RepID=E1R978_SEDSS|nr:TetR/AcrR family transcriptional regulator [Sediminispirochaeta smaragdinae]ADK83047.1 transcriptional regulator, TetR family [Sediminispirochaeta smaragdinae DSM 11293]